MRVIQTGDLHLGKTLGGFDLQEDQKYILRQIIELCRIRHAELLIITGDIFDRSLPPVEAVALADDFLASIIEELRIPTVLISGNHDSPERLGYCTGLLAGRGLYVHTRMEQGFKPIKLTDQFGPLHFYAMPFIDPVSSDWARQKNRKTHQELWEAITDEYKKIFSDEQPVRRVLVAHCFAGEANESESERPLTVGGTPQIKASLFDAFQYTALGHLHRPQSPASIVSYSGSPLGYSASEADQEKYVLQVDIDQDGHILIDKVLLEPLHPVRSIRGKLSEILSDTTLDQGAYTAVKLTDSMPVYEAFQQLSSKFPRLFHLSRDIAASIRSVDTGMAERREALDDSDLAMLESFFLHCTGNPLGVHQREILTEVLTKLGAGDSA